MTECALDVSGVDGGYDEVQVLRDLTLHLESDEIVCIIGSSGAGKSTVLKTTFSLLKPWTGSIELSGRDITGEEPGDLARVGMGYVPQMGNVFPSLTIDENLRMDGVAHSEGLQARIDRLYNQFSILDEKRSAKVRTLSGSQQQVLASVRALVMEPEAFLIDESSTGLAPNIVQSIFEDVKKVNEPGVVVLMVEQNAREGLGVSDRDYVLGQGTVAYKGDTDGLLNDPEVSQLYMGSANYRGIEGEWCATRPAFVAFSDYVLRRALFDFAFE